MATKALARVVGWGRKGFLVLEVDPAGQQVALTALRTKQPIEIRLARPTRGPNSQPHQLHLVNPEEDSP